MTIKNGHSREHGNIGHTRRRKTKQKQNTICVGHHYAQTNTNSINKTWVHLYIISWLKCINQMYISEQFLLLRYLNFEMYITSQFKKKCKSNCITVSKIEKCIKKKTKKKHWTHHDKDYSCKLLNSIIIIIIIIYWFQKIQQLICHQ